MSTEPEHHPSFSSHHHPSPPPLSPLFSSPPTLASTLNYFTEPITYTFAGLARRLSDDQVPTPLARALNVNHNGAMTDPSLGVYRPNPQPYRRPSPFQPPPLTPLSLEGYSENTSGRARLIGRALAEEIRLLIPARLQLVDQWRLLYSLEQDGSTLSTLYGNCEAYQGKRGGFIVVVKDADGGVFGAYLSEAPKSQAHYYGSGECFLWRAVRLPAMLDLSSLPPPPSEDTTHLQRMTTISASQHSSSASLASLNKKAAANGSNGANGHKNGFSTPDTIRFKAFPYSGENDFTIFCQHEYLSVGGGDGHYGLWLDDTLSKGVSETCPTFGNERLSDEGSKFDVLGVEVWYIGS